MSNLVVVEPVRGAMSNEGILVLAPNDTKLEEGGL